MVNPTQGQNGIRLSQLLALLQQGPQQQPPVAPPPTQEKMGLQVPFLQANKEFMQGQPQAATPPPQAGPQLPPQKWRGVGMGGGMVQPPAPGPEMNRNKGAENLLMRTHPFGAVYSDVRDIGKKVVGQAPDSSSILNLLGDVSGSGRIVDQSAPPQQSQAPQDPKQPSLFERLDEERGGTAQDKQLAGMQGPGPIAKMFTSAAQEVMQRGADTPDKADQILRSEFQDDPEIEDALAQAKIRYGQARQRSQTGPGVLDYVGYVLATLAGFNPMQASEAISRRGEKREDERLALQDLMGAQQMKIRNNQMNAQRADQLGMSYEKMGMQQAKEKQRLAERGEDKNFDRLKAGRGATLQRLNQLQQAQSYSQNPAEKKALQLEIDQLKHRALFFQRQLGEPNQVDAAGNPIGQASPDAMRLLGLG